MRTPLVHIKQTEADRVETDEDGRAEIEAWEGVPSVVSAFTMGTDALSMSRGMKEITPTGPAASVEIELEELTIKSIQMLVLVLRRRV